MSLKCYQIAYLVVFTLLVGLSVVFGVLCFRYNRLPEGLIIIGVAFTLVTIGFAVTVMSKGNERDMVFVQAGAIMVEMDCVCRVNGARSKNCRLLLCNHGFMIDMTRFEFDVYAYNRIEQVVVNNHSVSFYLCLDKSRNDVKFICNNTLKVKAVAKLLEKKCVRF